METVADLLSRERRSDAPAARDEGDTGRAAGAGGDAAPGADYSYHDLVTTAWKTANFFRARGVHQGATVAVVDDPAVPPVLALLGAAQLGAVTRFDPPRDVEADLLVGPGEAVLDYELPPGGTRVAYTAGPNVEDSGVEAFGRSVWSENPVAPPEAEAVPPGAPALWTPSGPLPGSDLLARAEAAAVDLDPGDAVVVRAPLSAVGTVAAGVLAPLLAGATVVFPGADTVGDVAVATGAAPEPRVLGVAEA